MRFGFFIHQQRAGMCSLRRHECNIIHSTFSLFIHSSIHPFIHPSCVYRFTCWDQRTNSRFDNVGVRLDYTMLDKSVSNYIDTDHKKLRLRCCNFPIDKDYNTEEASLHAATASGQFQGASFDGGGIVDATQKALDSQFGDKNGDGCYTTQRHTGIIYTPPSYSDHVAISLLLNDDFYQEHLNTPLQLDSKCPFTKKAQPHRSQTSISSFFGKGKVRGRGNVNGKGNKESNSQTTANLPKTSLKSSTLSKTVSSLSSSSSTGSPTTQSSRNLTSLKTMSSSSSSLTTNKSLKRKSSTEIKKTSSQKKRGTLHSFFKND